MTDKKEKEEKKKLFWQYDTETGEEQQTIFKEVKPETDKGEFVGDLFSYDEELQEDETIDR